MYRKIDEAILGDVPWQSFQVCYQGDQHGPERLDWMNAQYTVWFRNPKKVVRNLLGNADFMGGVDLSPLRSYDKAGRRQYHNFMSGDWAWEQAVRNPPPAHILLLMP
jgi:hypothetical protein